MYLEQVSPLEISSLTMEIDLTNKIAYRLLTIKELL